MTDPEQLLTDTLHRRADDTTFRPTPLGDVVATARGIRRHQRRRAVLAAAAAVVAVTVPSAVLLRADDAPSPRPTGPPPWVTERQTPSPGIDLSDLRQGAPPKVDYVDGRTYFGYAGARTLLPARHGISAVTPYHGGFLVADTRYFEGSVGLAQYDGSGAEVASWCSSGGPVVSADGTLTAWATGGCPEAGKPSPVLVHRGIASGMSDSEYTQQLDLPPQLTGFLGQEIVYTSGLGQGGVFVTDLGSPPRAIPGLGSAGGVDPTHGVVSGQSDDPEGATGLVVDATTGSVLWRKDGWRLGSFSPDGRYLVATRTAGTPELAILDSATGDIVRPVDLGAASLPDLIGLRAATAWEDATHLLVVGVQDSTQAIVRVDDRGHVERATPATPVTDSGTVRYVFAAHS